MRRRLYAHSLHTFGSSTLIYCYFPLGHLGLSGIYPLKGNGHVVDYDRNEIYPLTGNGHVVDYDGNETCFHNA